MFREIRRSKNKITDENIKNLLKNTRIGIFSVNGDCGYPYAIPMNFLYDEKNNSIYMHSAKVGHKVDSLRNSDKVCFTVVGEEKIKEEDWAPFVESVVTFGKCKKVDDEKRALEILKEFAMKYYPSEHLVDEQISKSGKACNIYVIDIEDIKGKEVKEK